MLGLIAAGLDAALERAGLPYGYTITIWSSGQVLIDARGTPSAWLVPSYALGALCGFGALKLAARRARPRAARGTGSSLPAWILQAVTIATALGAVALVGRIDSDVVWLIGGFVATSAYLGGMAAAIVLQGGTA